MIHPGGNSSQTHQQSTRTQQIHSNHLNRVKTAMTQAPFAALSMILQKKRIQSLL